MIPSSSAPSLPIPQVQINDDNDRTLTPETASELLQLRAQADRQQEGGDNNRWLMRMMRLGGGGSGNGSSSSGISLSVPSTTSGGMHGRRKSAVELNSLAIGGLLRPPVVPQGGRNRRYSDCLGLGLALPPPVKRSDRRGSL